MIYALAGLIGRRGEHWFALDVSGVSFKVFASPATLSKLPPAGVGAKIFCHLHVREDALELYGFLTESELELFEKLNSISGIGPKSALGILAVAPADQISAAINAGRTELLTRASGVGRKTAERVVLELKGKLGAMAPQTLSLMESDAEIEETLVSLGYTNAQAKSVLAKVDPKTTGFTERLREAIKKAKQ